MSKNIKNYFIENRLSQLREENHLKVIDEAKIIGVNHSTISCWETNKNNIPTNRIISLANLYNINIDYMLNLTNKRKNIKEKTEINLETIAKRLSEIRKELNLSYEKLAKILDTSKSTVWAYEKAKTLILSTFLYQLSKNYNYSIDWMLGRSNEKYINNKKDIKK